MSEVVLGASVFLKWFHTEGERNLEQAGQLRARFEAGELRVLVPSLAWLEVLNVAARRLGWARDRLERLAATLDSLGFVVVEPELRTVAVWSSRGLGAYDAAYVAIAEQTGAQLITKDRGLIKAGGTMVTSLGDIHDR